MYQYVQVDFDEEETLTVAIGCCIVTAAHLEARPLVLAELVRNGRA